MKHSLIILFALALFTTSCKKDKETKPAPPEEPQPESCDATRPPIIMVHGLMASGDTYSNQAMRFEQNKQCGDRIFLFDWNSTSSLSSASLPLLQTFIDSIKTLTGATGVYLVGHSAGSGLVYDYCTDSVRAQSVKKLVYIGGSAKTSPAGPNGEIPTLNIYSDGDNVVTDGGDMPEAVNVHYTNEDHYEIATCRSTFIEMYRFFFGNDPQYPDIMASGGEIRISGKAVVLGSNATMVGATVQIYELDATTGQRINATADFTYTIPASGAWGPFTAKANTVYEYRIKGPGVSDRAVSYFREKAIRSNQFVYLRTMPTTLPLSFIFGGIPSNGYPALGVFSSSTAVITGRDALTVDGTLLTATSYYDASRTTIASFLYDANNNSATDLTDAGYFNLAGQFMAGIDVYFAQNATPMVLNYNGRTLNIRRIASSDAITVPVFD